MFCLLDATHPDVFSYPDVWNQADSKHGICYIQNLDIARCLLSYRHSLGPLGKEALRTWVSFILTVSRSWESRKTFMRLRRFSLKSERAWVKQSFNRALPEGLLQRKPNTAHCSSSDSAGSYPVSGPRYTGTGCRELSSERSQCLNLILYWYQTLYIKLDSLLPKSEPDLLDWLQNSFYDQPGHAAVI